MASDPRKAAEDWFGARLSPEELRRRSASGIATMFARRFLTQAIAFAAMLVLARLLQPRDFGLVAIAGVFIGLASVLKDMGLSAATIRTRSLTPAQASNLFWLNLALSAAVLAATLGGASALGRYFDDSRVGVIAMVLVGSLALSALGTQHRALLRRAIRFDLSMRIDVTSALTQNVIAVLAAVAGLGYWALLAGSVAGDVVGTALAWRYCNWVPGRPQRNVGTLPLVTFGLRMFTFSGLAYVSTNLHTLLIGRIAGPTAAGLYNRGFSLHRLFREWILDAPRQVLPATMARMAEDPAQLASYYYRSCALVVMAAIPVTFVGLALPHELIRVLVGPRWDASADVVRWLAVGVVGQVICATSGWVYSSVGAAERMIRWGLMGWGVMIAGTLVGAQFMATYGISALAMAASISILLITWPCMSYAFHGTALDWTGLMQHLRGPLLAGVAAGAGAWGVLLLIEGATAWLRLVAGAGTFGAMNLALLVTVGGQRQVLLEAWQTVRDQVRGI